MFLVASGNRVNVCCILANEVNCCIAVKLSGLHTTTVCNTLAFSLLLICVVCGNVADSVKNVQ